MNKLVRKFLFTVLLFVGLVTTVNASSNKYDYYTRYNDRPSSVTKSFSMAYNFGSYQGKKLYGKNGQKSYDAHIKYNKSIGGTAWLFCIEASKDSVSGTLNYKAMIKDPGLVYILKTGESLDHTDYWNYYKIQLAVWFYMRDVYPNSVTTGGNYTYFDKNGGSNESSIAVVTYARKLADKAIEIHNSYVEPAFTSLTVASNTLKLENGYLVSEELNINTKGVSTYTVTVTGGELIDSNNNVVSGKNVKVGTKLRVRANVSNDASVTVKVTINYEDEYAVIYNNGDSGDQDVVYGYYIEQQSITKSLTLTYKNESGEVEVSKVDATTKSELPGAHLVIKNSNGEVVEEWTSTTEVHKVKLVAGTYTLCETIQPVGYVLKTTCAEFKVEAGKTTKVTMENEVAKQEIEFSKVDGTTSKELAGAHLVLKQGDTIIDEWTSTTEVHKVKLLPGKYTLTETIAPEGYHLSTETIEFEVKLDGTVTKVEMKNYPIKNGEVLVSKVDATTGSELAGAHLVIKDSNGKVVDEWVSTTEIHKVSLKPGKYTLSETIAPEGYVLSNETITFEVTENGVTDPIVMKNELEEKEVLISKQDATTKKELAGAHLEVKNEKGEIVDSWVSTNEVHKVSLKPGKYTLTETIAPEGYVLSTESIEFEVTKDGVSSTIVMYNEVYEVPHTGLNNTKSIIIGTVMILMSLSVVLVYGKKQTN